VRRALLVLAAAALLTGTARADTFAVVPSAAPALPSAETPNLEGSLLLPGGWTMFASETRALGLDELRGLWQRAGEAYGIPWEVLGAINKIETNFGSNMGPSSAGAVGWMQFMPDTWLRWGLDASGDGFADPWNPEDAVHAAARYLAAAGGRDDLRRGVFAYNHADWYVNDVLELAGLMGQGGGEVVDQLEGVRARVAAAEAAVVEASRRLREAEEADAAIAAAETAQLAESERIELLSDRLARQQEIVQNGVERRASAQVDVEARRTEVAAAEAELAAARDELRAASFSPGADSLLGGARSAGNYVFPVGGGPATVSAGRDHHDYPAADIAAPEGAPVYALVDAVVVQALHVADARCGLGLRLRGADGNDWQYCHLSYLEPTVQPGAVLAAGTPVGLVGSTGRSTGPHLHLALKPETAYPQQMAWFQAFEGTAFRWQGELAPAPAEPVFRALGEPGDVVLFSRS
jgi:murein DD-endopeptidase MepM/ murein hydrolase activator NlpD